MENYTKKEVDMLGTICHYNSKGQYHRFDGPAIEYVDGVEVWYINGKLHRLSGPSIKCRSGERQWHIYGIEYTKSRHGMLCLFHILEPQRIDLNPV